MPGCSQPRGPTGPRLVGPPPPMPTTVMKGGLPIGTWSLILIIVFGVGSVIATGLFGISMAAKRQAAIDQAEWVAWVRDCRARTTHYCDGYYGQSEDDRP